jgi:transcriptional regulator with XRE-family HTH domain
MTLVVGAGSPQRKRLGRALRDLRTAAGLTGIELAERLGVGQSTVSRFELGQQLPSQAEVDRWAEATGAGRPRLRALHELREAAATEATAWRRRARDLVALQDETGELEASARTIQAFQPAIIPGLCQTPAYAQAIRELRWPDGHPDLAKAVAAQMRRQEILFEPGRRFEFVIGEPALRWRLGPPPMMLAQLDRLAQVATMPNVTASVLPLDVEVHVWHTHGFVIFDREADPVVHLETLAGGINLFDPDDRYGYAKVFERLRDASVTGPELGRLLARTAADLRL